MADSLAKPVDATCCFSFEPRQFSSHQPVRLDRYNLFMTGVSRIAVSLLDPRPVLEGIKVTVRILPARFRDLELIRPLESAW